MVLVLSLIGKWDNILSELKHSGKARSSGSINSHEVWIWNKCLGKTKEARSIGVPLYLSIFGCGGADWQRWFKKRGGNWEVSQITGCQTWPGVFSCCMQKAFVYNAQCKRVKKKVSNQTTTQPNPKPLLRKHARWSQRELAVSKDLRIWPSDNNFVVELSTYMFSLRSNFNSVSLEPQK